MKQKNADLIMLVQAGLLGISPLLAMFLLKTKNYTLYFQTQEFLYISKISLTDSYWFIALLISITAGAGIAIYYQSGKTKRGALLCLSAFALLKSLLFLPLLVEPIFFPGEQTVTNKLMPFLLVYYLLWLIASFTVLFFFSRSEKKLLKEEVAFSGTNDTLEGILKQTDLQAVQVVIVAKEKRFAHYLADSFLIILIAGPLMAYFLGMGLSNIYTDSRYSLTLLHTAIGSVVYYLLFEGLFGSTPGKYLTGARVVHENGKNAGFVYILIRTFCRLIPFNPLSFLGNRGWHDLLSKTEVVELVREREAGLLVD